jgi:hypothetical protein
MWLINGVAPWVLGLAYLHYSFGDLREGWNSCATDVCHIKLPQNQKDMLLNLSYPNAAKRVDGGGSAI